MHIQITILACLWATVASRSAVAEVPPDPRVAVGVDEKLGQGLPPGIQLIDEEGNRVFLQSLIDKPTILTLNYFRCAGLCTPLLNGVVDMLRRIDQVPGKDFQVITVSFDPRDNAEIAGEKKQNHVKQLGPGFPRDAWRFLTGDPVSTKRLADAVGFKFAKHGEDYVHAAAIMMLSRGGMVTRYLYGTTFLPEDVKMAVREATESRTGPTISRLLRLCYSYDPSGHAYSLSSTRIAGAFTLMLALGFGVAIIARRKRH